MGQESGIQAHGYQDFLKQDVAERMSQETERLPVNSKSWVRDPALITIEMYYYKGGKGYSCPRPITNA